MLSGGFSLSPCSHTPGMGEQQYTGQAGLDRNFEWVLWQAYDQARLLDSTSLCKCARDIYDVIAVG